MVKKMLGVQGIAAMCRVEPKTVSMWRPDSRPQERSERQARAGAAGPPGSEAYLLGGGRWQEIFGLTPSQLSGPARIVTAAVPTWLQFAGGLV